MSTSRIFIRGLPPSISDDDFKTHFAKRFSITDVKLLAKRRIGYVGFKTPEDAQKAVKYFNKSFIRMSRIAVELADNSLQTAHVVHPTARKSPAAPTEEPDPSAPATKALKRKREEPSKQEDRKLNEYLGLMTAPSKLKTWRDGEPPAFTDKDVKEPDVQAASTTMGQSHGNGQDPAEPVVRAAVPAAQDSASHPDEQPPSEHSPDNLVEDEKNEEGNSSLNKLGPAQPGTSDTDWMRSRTSRLLGLVEDDIDEDLNGEEGRSRLPPESPPAQSKADTFGQLDEQARSVENVDMKDGIVEDSRASPVTDDLDPNTAALLKSGRLFLRNLAYTVTELDIREQFSTLGNLEEVHVSLDPKTGEPKGFAFVQYENREDAVTAYQTMDGTVFQGRLLHIIPAGAKRENKLDEFALSKLPLKKQRQVQKRAEASSTSFNWNALYMNPDAVMSSVADRLGVSKSEVFDPTSSDAAVKQAQAETHVIQETKTYFASNGVDLDAFASRERGDTAILVKNFPFGTKINEIKTLFEEHGVVSRVLMPPSGTIAIVEFSQNTQARSAFHSLAYRKFKDSILFLEKAPKSLFTTSVTEAQHGLGDIAPTPGANKSSAQEFRQQAAPEDIDTSTLFVRNLNFATTNERFTEVFKPLGGFVSARVKTKPDPKKSGNVLSMGFGFLEFRTNEQAKAALAAMDGYNLDGHALVIKASHKGLDAAEERRKDDQAKRNRDRKSKLIIKNLPFEATKKDIQNLFKSYGQLRAVRVPKKFDSSRKGFAFAEFMTTKEAENAMEALRNTHLLGRRLVLDYAAGDAEDPEAEIARMQQKVGRQTNNIALKKLASSSERRKFDIDGGNEEDEA